MPQISVIVPVYRAEKFLHRCVDSVLGQTFRDFELILLDDGSPDGSGAICDAYAARDSRVRAIHQGNAGVCAARNTCGLITENDNASLEAGIRKMLTDEEFYRQAKAGAERRSAFFDGKRMVKEVEDMFLDLVGKE